MFSYNTKNFIDGQGTIRGVKNGFVLESDQNNSGLAIYVDNAAAVVDHCWFRGAWFDPQTVVWDIFAMGGSLISSRLRVLLRERLFMFR